MVHVRSQPSRREAGAALLAAAAAPAWVGLGGCGGLARPSAEPMELILDRAPGAEPAPVLLVLLPGAHMTLAEMQREGLVAAVRSAGLHADVLLAGTTLEHVYERSAFERLRGGVLEPGGVRETRPVWLAGISLGAFLALGCAMRLPGVVHGIVAIAPYLGTAKTVQALRQAGSARAWARHTPPSGLADDIDGPLWRWLAEPPPGAPSIHLGFGSEDRFAPAHRLLAELLPPERVQVVPGGHTWRPWRTLWAQWLAQAPLPRLPLQRAP
jgi:pimeloyl-ACP methyl ester carboxylesterase